MVSHLVSPNAIIGISQACNFPEEIQTSPIVAFHNRLNTEKIVVLSPSLVVGVGLSGNLNTAIFDRPLILEYPTSIADFYEQLAHLGNRLGVDATPHIATLSEASRVPTPNVSPRTLILISASPFIAAGPSTFMSDLISHAGGRNCLTTPVSFPRLSVEQIIALNPDVIVTTSPSTHQQILDHSLLSVLPAVRANRVISTIDPDILLRSTPRFPQAIHALYRFFHDTP